MRRAAKIDENQPEIVRSLRKAGCMVQSMAAIGSGCPDLLVSRAGVWHVLEVKDGAKPPSERRLTPDQARWIAAAQGRVSVVESVEQAFRAVGVLGRPIWHSEFVSSPLTRREALMELVEQTLLQIQSLDSPNAGAHRQAREAGLSECSALLGENGETNADQ